MPFAGEMHIERTDAPHTPRGSHPPMAVALEHEVAALPHPNAKPGVHSFSRAWVAVLLLSDVLLFLAATYLAALFVKHYWNPVLPIRHVAIPATLTAALSALVFSHLGLYRRSFAMSVRDELYHAIAALSLASAPVLIAFSIALVGGMRAFAHRVRDIAALAHPRRIAVVGHPSRLEFAEDAIRELPNARVFRLAVPNLDGIGAVNPDAIASQPWFRYAVEWGCETLVFTEILAPSLMPHVLAAASAAGITIAFAPPRIRVHAYDLSIETIGKQALIVAKPLRACQPGARLAKRAFDVAIATLALAVFLPVMGLVALAIALEDRGPILYRQERVGRGGKPFQIFKF